MVYILLYIVVGCEDSKKKSGNLTSSHQKTKINKYLSIHDLKTLENKLKSTAEEKIATTRRLAEASIVGITRLYQDNEDFKDGIVIAAKILDSNPKLRILIIDKLISPFDSSWFIDISNENKIVELGWGFLGSTTDFSPSKYPKRKFKWGKHRKVECLEATVIALRYYKSRFQANSKNMAIRTEHFPGSEDWRVTITSYSIKNSNQKIIRVRENGNFSLLSSIKK